MLCTAPRKKNQERHLVQQTDGAHNFRHIALTGKITGMRKNHFQHHEATIKVKFFISFFYF